MLVLLLGTGALLVLAIPFIDGWMLDRVVAWDPGPRLNPLVATILLFGIPSVVLGTISPVAVRLKARSLEHLGRTAGRLFAVSTAGSIAGTFLTAFWLIPELGTDQVLAAAAVALMFAAAAVALVERLAVALAVSLALAGVSIGAVVSLAPESGAPCRRPSCATGRRCTASRRRRTGSATSRTHSPATRSSTPRTPSTTGSPSSRTTPRATCASTARSRAACTSTIRSGRASSTPTTSSSRSRTGPSAKRVLYIGLGGGSAQKRSWRDFPSMQIDTVEIDPEVVKVAYKYFALPRDPRLKVSRSRTAAASSPRTRPLGRIVIDAFYSDSIPFHLATREFLELARSRLAPGGLVATNIIGAVKGPDSRLFRSMLRTYRAVFPTVNVHPVDDGGGDRLRSATSSSSPARVPRRRRSSCWSAGASVRRRSPGAPDLTDAIRGRVDAPISTARRAGAHGRLRAHRRAAAPLRLEGVAPGGGGSLLVRELADDAPDERRDRAGIEGFREEAGRAHLEDAPVMLGPDSPVRTTTGSSRVRSSACSAAATAKPSSTGIERSSSTTAGLAEKARSSASWPFAASSTS